MRAKWLWMMWLAGLAVACGKGEAIFNVDVYSFLPAREDTVPYVIPPNTPKADTGSAPQQINLPGVGSSAVDSIQIFGTLDLYNQSGTGTIALQLFMAPDSLGTYAASNAVLTVTPKTVSGSPPVPVADTVQGKLLANANPLFTRKQLWVRVAAEGSNASLTTPVVGHMVLTKLRLSVFIDDKFF
jgi:hypothetical protein